MTMDAPTDDGPTFEEWLALVREAGEHTFLAVSCWVRAVAWIVSPAVGAFVAFERELEPFWLAVQAGVVALVVALWLLRRLIVRRRYVPRARAWLDRTFAAPWRALKANVKEKSRLAAALLPHALYAACVGVLMTLAPDATHAVAHRVGLPGISLTLPALSAFFFPFEAGRESGAREWLKYFVVSGMCWMAVSVLQGLGALEYALELVPAIHTVGFFFFAWLALPLTSTAIEYAYAVMEGLFSRHIRTIHVDVDAPQSYMVLRLLLSEERANWLTHAIRDAFVVVLGAVFLVTPASLTYFGTVYVAVGCPVYLSILSLKNNSTPSVWRWLSYWVVFGLLVALLRVRAVFERLWFGTHIQHLFALYIVLFGYATLFHKLRALAAGAGIECTVGVVVPITVPGEQEQQQEEETEATKKNK